MKMRSIVTAGAAALLALSLAVPAAAGDFDIFEKWMSGEAKVGDYPYIEEALSVWDDRMAYPRIDAMVNNQDKALELFIAGEGAMIWSEGAMMPLINGMCSDSALPIVKTLAQIKADGNCVSQGAFTKPRDT